MSAEGWESCPCGFSHRTGDPSPLHSAEWLAAENVRLTARLVLCERLLFRWWYGDGRHEGEPPVSVATSAYFAPKDGPPPPIAEAPRPRLVLVPMDEEARESAPRDKERP